MKHHGDGPDCALCNDKILTAHPYMQDWFLRKKKSYINLHVSWAYRNPEEQETSFDAGLSRMRYPNSKHNYMRDGKPCSLALDVFQITEDGVAVFREKFCGVLNSENEADHEPIRWGGKFKLAHGGDANHFEYTGPI